MIIIGMDYYPEQWDESLWQEDIDRMASLGIKVIRLGEFAWCRLEPEEGKFTFDWLDRIVDMTGKAGMKVILGTPTNCPPLWLFERHPETLQCERDGRRTWVGIRGHRCMTSPVFRQYAGRIVRLLASRYAHRPEIAAWQIDNEIESNHCTCPACTQSFRKFLQRKYKTLEALNKAWGNVVWSGEYSDWNQVKPFVTSPNNRPDWYNPAFMLDYERFCSWSSADYVAFQTKIIKEADPDAVVTTNACFSANFQNFKEEFRPLDVASYDNYPAAVIPDDPDALYSNAFVLDLVRSWKHNLTIRAGKEVRQDFWIMEQLGGPMGCWGPVKPSMEPGMLEGYAMQAIAHGADLVSFFRWRTAVSGAEMFCYGLLDHDNRDNRYIHEFSHFTRRLQQPALQQLDQTNVHSQVAILYSPDSEYAFRTQMQSEGFSYWTQLRLFHEACMNLGVNVDILTGQDLDDVEQYKVIIIPACVIVSPDLASRISDFVAKGGTAVFTDRTAVKNENGNCYLGKPLPAYLDQLCGLRVTETDAIGTGTNAVAIERNWANHSLHFGSDRIRDDLAGDSHTRTREDKDDLRRVQTTEAREYPVTLWCDLLEPSTAQVIGRYTHKFYKGTPAVTCNSYGRGKAYYIGTVGAKGLYRDVLEAVLPEQNIPVMHTLPLGVECTQRSQGKDTYCFYFNNTMKEQSFPVLFMKEGVPVQREVRLSALHMSILHNQCEWL